MYVLAPKKHLGKSITTELQLEKDTLLCCFRQLVVNQFSIVTSSRTGPLLVILFRKM